MVAETHRGSLGVKGIMIMYQFPMANFAAYYGISPLGNVIRIIDGGEAVTCQLRQFGEQFCGLAPVRYVVKTHNLSSSSIGGPSWMSERRSPTGRVCSRVRASHLLNQQCMPMFRHCSTRSKIALFMQ